MNASQQYLPHVDGLRGLAVLAVLLFHLDIALFSGGYAGVDVFFVISGYLISAHVLAAMQAGSFSWRQFYWRRARRLLPALFFTLLLTLVAGILLYPAPQLARLGVNALQTLFSIANIGYWLESGYFDTVSIGKPLLHTWSLAVEEQFYLIWPVLLLLLARQRRGVWLIALLGLASLLAAEYGLLRDPSLVFFMMPFRIAEFCIGALLYWIPPLAHRREALHKGLGALGCVLVLLPMALYDEHTHFPGLTALLPCVGAALLILWGSWGLAGQLLANRVLVFLGRISYSLYLLHWPLIVFYQHVQGPELQVVEQLGLAMAAIAGATVMYVFVECPFRHGRSTLQLTERHAAITLGVTLLLLSGLGLQLYRQAPAWTLQRAPWSAEQILAGKNNRYLLLNRICQERGNDNCWQPSPDRERNVLILGDSHATDGLNIFALSYPDYHYVMHSLPGGCPPIVEADNAIISPRMQGREECIAFNRNIFMADFLADYDTVIISVYFQWYGPNNLLHAVEKIRSLSDARILVLGNFIALKREMAELYNLGIDPRDKTDYLESFARYETALEALAEGRYIFLSKQALFCTQADVKHCKLFFGDAPFSYDQHHLSLEAARYAAEALQERFPDFPATPLPSAGGSLPPAPQATHSLIQAVQR